MIKVTFYKDSTGEYVGFKLKGHAGYAESGQDIVCAAVSALCINTLNSIETFTKDDIRVKADEKSGTLQLKFTGLVSKKSKLLIDSLKLGLKGIEEDNNTEYISVTTKEV